MIETVRRIANCVDACVRKTSQDLRPQLRISGRRILHLIKLSRKTVEVIGHPRRFRQPYFYGCSFPMRGEADDGSRPFHRSAHLPDEFLCRTVFEHQAGRTVGDE